ncbi:YqjF family protein [Priestia koreensis]|uniref:YqjF family protein n=1 Tax=Priestia koreensis TaxID=284581 RepID=UPI00345B3AEB
MEKKGWIMKQTWNKLLFLHWPVTPEFIKPFLPSQLEVDTFDGKAWIAIVPFEMDHIRFRGLPSVPHASRLWELNVRTYVTYKGKPGVYFFSLDANHPLAVSVARNIFNLPYYRATMKGHVHGEEISLSSTRTHRNVRHAALTIRYKPIGPPQASQRRELAYFLTERYCLYIVKKGKVYRGDIFHDHWPLQKAECEIYQDTLSTPYGRPANSDEWTLHYADKVQTYIYPFRYVGR